MPRPTSDRRATERKHPWPMVRLGDVCIVQRGVRVTRKDLDDNGKYNVYQNSLKPLGKYNSFNCEAHSPFMIMALAAGEPGFSEEPFWAADDCTYFKNLKGLDNLYLYFLLSANKDELKRNVKQTTIPRLSNKFLESLEIPLPPLSVQREIVARLEWELAAVEKIKKDFEALAETARAEFKAELKEVFEEISRGGAETRRLGDVCDVLAGYAFKGNGFSATGVPICGGLIIAPDRIKWEECRHWPSVNGLEAYLLDAGDVVVALDRPWISEGFKVGMIDHDDCPCLLIQRTARLRAGKQIDNKYLLLMLRDERFREHCTTSGTTVPHISHKDIESYTIPFLSLSAQREVVARLDSAKARAEKLELKAREGVAVCETMRKAILKEAFE